MLNDLLSDIDDLLDLYHFLVDTGTVPDVDITEIVRSTAEEETTTRHRGG